MNNKTYTEREAIDLAVKSVKGMGISDAHKKDLENARKEGYEQAVRDMKQKLDKMYFV